jgi:NAD(P)-dependent dehydrogenase (short-subunit alcohol dehydrogenase family)
VATVVMTGGTSGLGAVAAQQFLREAHKVFLGARKPDSIGQHALLLDLTNLEQVRLFAEEVKRALGKGSIDALVLNAGGYARGRTTEGYDATFVLNHLAHYLLLRLLWDQVSVRGSVVLTTSGTHDPAERTVVPPPRHANAMWLAKPELDDGLDKSPRIAAARAYAASKLCVVLTARALAERDDARARAIRVLAYDPGPTPGTGLVRDQGALIRFVWGPLAAPLRLLMRKANTMEDAGGTLYQLALGKEQPADGKLYVALRRGQLTYPELSELARRDDLVSALWRDSAQLVGLAP